MARLGDLSLFYRSLGQLLTAGVSITRALDSLPNKSLRGVSALRPRIEAGDTFAEALATQTGTFPADHIKLIAIAEKSGRLDVVLKDLADFTDQRLEMRRTITTGLILPALILHVAAFVVPLPKLFLETGSTGYLSAALGFLVFVWCSLLILALLFRTLPASVLDPLLHAVPLVGRTRRELDLWRVASSLEMLLNAGIGVIEGLRLCAGICHGPRLADALRRAADQAESTGEPPSKSLEATHEFPLDFLSIWATGEESGRLDDALRRLADQYAANCRRRMQELARWLPRIVYALVSIYLITQIFRLAGNYVNMLNSIE